MATQMNQPAINAGANAMKDIGSSLQDQYAQLKDSSQTYLKQGTSFVKKYPIATVLGAVAVGAILTKALCSSSKKEA